MIFYFHFALLFVFTVSLTESLTGKKGETDLDNPHRDPSLCEVCKFLTEELKLRLYETGKTKEVLEMGHGLDTKKKRKQYAKSELRLIEALTDPHVCNKILEYNIHAERKGSLRFAKGRSETMQTLRNLQNKGVKVDLGIPDELWDSPSASVTEMQRKCFKIVEDHEEDIEEWYFGSQEDDLTNFLCGSKVLKKGDKECLSEVWQGKQKTDENKNKAKTSSKSSKGDKQIDEDMQDSSSKDEL